MEPLQRNRAWARLTIDRAYKAAKQPGQGLTRETLLYRLEKLEAAYNDFMRMSQELYAYSAEENFVDPIEEVEVIEDKHLQTHALLHSQLASCASPHQASTFREDDAIDRLATQQASFLETFSATRNEQNVHLTKIQLPKFNGKYEDWITFRDLFLSAVGNKAGLSRTHKFQYLVSYLEGDALASIKHITITENNYEQAWDRLVKRYERKPLIIKSLVQSFLALPINSSNNTAVLRQIVDGADQAIRGLDALNVTSRDPWLIQLILNKLDEETRRKWAEKCDNNSEKTFNEFLEFLSHRCDSFEACSPLRSANTRRVALLANAHDMKGKKCLICKDNHMLWQCVKFKQLSPSLRREAAQKQKLCFNCLAPSHSVSSCQSKHTCKKCSSRHHTLLHDDRPTLSSAPSRSSNQQESIPAITSQCLHMPVSDQAGATSLTSSTAPLPHTFLPTVTAAVKDKWGNKVNCRILLDSGSTISFASEAFVQRIGLPRTNGRISVSGLSACNAGVTRGRVNLTLLSKTHDLTLDISAFVLNKLTSHIPVQTVNLPSSLWNSLMQLPLADPKFAESNPIDVLIGSDQLWSIYTGEQKYIGSNMPILLNSVFGWVVAGSYLSGSEGSLNAAAHHATIDIDALFRSFMEVEDVVTPSEKIDRADPAEAHLIRTHTRRADGTYIVSYPFKDKTPQISSTLQQAITRLQHMERRFIRDPSLKPQYIKFMREYISLGHMIRIAPNEIDCDPSECFYLAHHAVLKPDSSTTKCRVVFDGSCKDSSGHSLNDRLHIGPPIQRDLFGVCVRFRQHRYVFSADIEKMFRGIMISNPDTNFQRIVWREDENSPMEHYRLLTVTYGLASSPFLAVRVLKQLADDYKANYPQAARVILQDTYVDDIATGCDQVDQLLQLKSELVEILKCANFKLQKWCSNCKPLLETLPRELCEHTPVDIGVEPHNFCVKLLGIQWSPDTDEFQIAIKMPPESENEPTKRNVLSTTAKIFDPLGIVSPSVVLFKILLQETWCQGVGWDDPLPPTLSDRWKKLMSELHYLSNVKIPRQVAESGVSVEIHGFADASSSAYAAAVYCRSQLNNGSYVVHLIAAKTRVAPLKPLSIPRLELSAAHLLTKLVASVTSSLSLEISAIWCWSDSEIVLHWLSSPPRRWTPFVCNRTADILDVCPRHHWQHVRSADNPADCASRGVLPSELTRHPLWWNGPSWLSLPRTEWPTGNNNTPANDMRVISEQRNTASAIVLCAQDDQHVLDKLINRSSTWIRLLRVWAYCQRFIQRCGRKQADRKAPINALSAYDLKLAANAILRHSQSTTFKEEMYQLQRRQPLKTKSPLLRFTPYLDEFGVIRVGGRIKNADLPSSVKHPILLSKVSNVSQLICRYIHVKYLHPGVDATFALVRQHYWIIGCRNIVRKIVFSCKTCFMQRRSTSEQLMADLPAIRLQPTRCFQHCGLDYAGPVQIKLSRTRNAKIGKAWFCLFICMSTKAIHIELVSDLTTDAFLAAFRRFVARRGPPTDLYSDNGTTFRGAQRVLNELQKLATSEQHIQEVSNALAAEGVQWHFIPPSAPHFGGLWESGIRSIKMHLRRVVGNSVLTFEEYCTILAQIEAIINSRPLCASSDTECDALTPAHFMIGAPYTSIPEPSLLDVNLNRLQHWRHLQAMVQGFWKRWHVEYLTSLQPRSKWQQQQVNIEPDAVVLLKEPNLPPSKWIMGRVVAVTRGTDGLVRVATVKTSGGQYVRPIAKIAVLPTN